MCKMYGAYLSLAFSLLQRFFLRKTQTYTFIYFSSLFLLCKLISVDFFFRHTLQSLDKLSAYIHMAVLNDELVSNLSCFYPALPLLGGSCIKLKNFQIYNVKYRLPPPTLYDQNQCHLPYIVRMLRTRHFCR